MANVSMNRLANTNNPFQGKYKKVLCVCSAGLLRSPTAAWVLSNEPFNFNTRAVGTTREYALIPIDEALLTWADEIVVMDGDQQRIVNEMLQMMEDHEKLDWVHNLDIPDDYQFRNDDLVNMIADKCRSIFAK